MEFSLEGIPIHTRTLSVALSAAEPDGVSFAGYVLDLRKRGFVPVAGDLQGPGIIHHMQVEGDIDPRDLRVRSISARMPTVAFEPSTVTAGETCRDVVRAPEALAGTALDGRYSRRVSEEIGGLRGCSHVLTLVHLLGPTAAWALHEDERLHHGAARRAGERLFRRDVVIDGGSSGGELTLALQLNDLHFRPAPDLAPAPDRFARQVEIRVAATLRMGEMQLVDVEIAERRRGPDDLETAAWQPRPERAAGLVGRSLRAGITADLLHQYAEPGEDQPLLDALLMLAPATVQCFASFTDTWTRIPWAKGPVGETGGHPDSCYMWRRSGPLGARRF